MRKILFLVFIATLNSGCAVIEPKDLGLLNHPSLDLNKPFASDSMTTVTGLKNFSSATGGGSCSVCAH